MLREARFGPQLKCEWNQVKRGGRSRRSYGTVNTPDARQLCSSLVEKGAPVAAAWARVAEKRSSTTDRRINLACVTRLAGRRGPRPIGRFDETDPNIKNSTVTTSFKPAKTETGLVVQVPPFIETGERIKVNTDDGAYIERA